MKQNKYLYRETTIGKDKIIRGVEKLNFRFMPINIEYVQEISSWNYKGFIEEVVMTPYFESFKKDKELKGPGGCDGFVALLNNEVAGLFEFTVRDNIMEIGLALKPNLVGKGLGEKYVKQGIEFGVQYYDINIDSIRLVVDQKNQAAIRVYEKVGFTKVEQQENEFEMRMIL